LGFNFRISELNAAVGVAQTRRVPHIVAMNQKNKKRLKDGLADLPGISFSRLPDEAGDSATFLNILMPDTAAAQKLVNAFNQQGVAGFNYWFLNMYHFINQWDHLKSLTTAAKLPVEVLGAPQNYHQLDLPVAQNVIGRLISFGIRCTWTDAEIDNLITRIKQCYAA